MNLKKALFALVAFLVSGFATDASATINVYASNQGGYYNTNSPNPTTTIYYPYIAAHTDTEPFVFFPAGGQAIPGNFVALDEGVQTTSTINLANPTNASTSVPQAIYLAISSTNSGSASTSVTTSTSNSNTYAVISVGPSSGGTTRYPVPIGWVQNLPGPNWVNCYVSSANGAPTTGCGAVNGNYSYAAYIPAGTTIEVAIYPYDICAPSSGAPQMVGCNAAGPTPFPSPVDTTSLNALQINVATVTDADITTGSGYSDVNTFVSNPAASGNITQFDTPVTLNISLQGQAGQITCPTPTAQTDTLYFPGDQQISLNTSAFGETGLSQPSSLIVVGNYSSSSGACSAATPATVALDQTSFQSGSAYSLLQNVQLGVGPQAPYTSGGTAVTGFVDSTQTVNNCYTLGFLVQDQAAFVASPVNLTTAVAAVGNVPYCEAQNIQASQINGFLNKNACFIANAAYDDTNAAPVQMLREFRDAVLGRSALGREFVWWYYRWSPPAAQWLRSHPIFRPLVLLLLVPVEAIAIATLHPALFCFGFLAVSLALFCVAIFMYRRREEEARQ
jgi:hypothetical protein